jgi:hypothetical protein
MEQDMLDGWMVHEEALRAWILDAAREGIRRLAGGLLGGGGCVVSRETWLFRFKKSEACRRDDLTD